MNFLVVGPGAMGCLFAVYLKKAGFHVTLMDHRPERASYLNEKGIELISGDRTERFMIPVTTGSLCVSPDAVIVCVKAYNTKAVAENIESCLGHVPFILTLQNGLGNMETLESVFGKEVVFGGVTSEGATLKDSGHVFHAGRGKTAIGPESRNREKVKQVVSAFNAAGFDTSAVENVTDLIWGKLLVNLAINPLTAITRLKNGRLLDYQGTRDIMDDVIKEALTLIKKKGGIKLPYPDPYRLVHEVCRATGENISSMLQDVMKQRPTEIDHINGAIVKEAEAEGIDVPVNRVLTHLVKVVEESYGETV